jgi:sarcosine oxidase, subunit gamma
MSTALRLSPIHEQLQQQSGTWRYINGMPVLATTSTHSAIATRLSIADLSCLNRFGVKGVGAADWLASQGIAVSQRSNTWCPLPDGGLVARLGRSEFLIEDSIQNTVTTQLANAYRSQRPAKVYPVLRQDFAFALWGEALNELLLQVCNVNFSDLSLVESPVILTSVIGVAMTVIPGERDGLPFYRLWCDGTFGDYVWKTLLTIVEELGGSAVGTEQCL